MSVKKISEGEAMDFYSRRYTRGRQPIYKLFWFWLIVAVVVIAIIRGIISAGSEKKEHTSATETTASVYETTALPTE